ncbi:hypothetical protein NG885_07955 [Enterococcus faecium]|uniref:hypothetical protein n=1 Tax=Enterococcus faecium TaxID=1352 RepID=UPI0020902AC3|nr:hypothetical protein [Enterococcus faecium]MCO5531601.1 hypothetical protein [Enterococcus faecium]
MTKENLLFSLIGVILGLLLFPQIQNLNLASIIKDLEDLNILGNILDIFGNIIIAVGSAVVAYFISRNEVKKANLALVNKQNNEKKIYLNLLKIEISTHSVIIMNIVSSKLTSKIDIERSISTLSFEIWKNYLSNFHLQSENLEKIYKYYIYVSSLKDVEYEEILQDDYKILKDTNETIKKVLALIEKEKDIALS